mgnify:FL=1
MKAYQRKNRASFAGALVCILISTAFAVVLQFFKGDVLDSAVAADAQGAVRYALLLIAGILGEILFYYCYRRCGARFVTGCTRELKRDIFWRILQSDYAAYKARPQGEYIAKYTSEADAIKARRFSMLPLFWEILFKCVLVSAALFLLNPGIAVITIILLTTPLYIPKLIESRLQRAQTEYLKAVEESIARLNDNLTGFEIIKNFSIERKIMERFEPVNDAAMEKLLTDTRLGALAQLLTTLISYLSYFVVLAVSAWLVLTGDFSAGDFFVAIGMIDQLSYPLISLAEIIRQLTAVRPACEAMERFLQPETCAAMPAGPCASSAAFERDIRFCSVSFSYDGRTPVLRNFNLTMEKGKRYLLKGPSGCGKTTAVNLLLRYYDVQDGSILIDGTPVDRAGNPYDRITVVRQEAVLFHDTLRNNLTMYRNIADDRLVRLLRALGLERFASTEALDGMIAESGANLSGGEKKRICLARALLRDTEVLILDEPLANLDDETAGRIEDLLLSIRDKTLLVVSHRFSEGKLGAFSQVLRLAPAA